MKKLVIVESPAKSKTIEKYLGKNFIVTSSKGHIKDLSTSGKGGLGIDVENDFTPKYVVSKDKKQVVKELKNEAKKVDHIFLATDPDREGEAISWHLAQELNLDLNQKNRVVFNEITKDAVLAAFQNPRQIDMDLVKSQETRRMLDRIIGFKLSSLLKNKIKSKSAGRVQSVALKLVVEREKEIQAFVPEEYWYIDAHFEKDKNTFKAQLAKKSGKKIKISSQKEADTILNELSKEYTVSNITQSKRKKSPKLPFITSTLQQEASSKLGFSARKTMRVAQGLYEGIQLANGYEGLITYMRTDSTRLSDGFVKGTQAYIVENFGKAYLGKYQFKKSENAQDAHEAIRVTNIQYHPDSIKSYLSNDEYKLYSLIYARVLASLMADAQNNTISITLDNAGYQFTTSGSQLIFDGYLKVYGAYESNKDVLLPKLDENEVLKANDVIKSQHFTEPPARYTEAKLIKELEEKGIGRPSTYATILDTIVTRGYALLEKNSETSKIKVFKPTEQGFLTVSKLDEFFSSIINVDYTASLETELDEIAEGQLDYLVSLRNFWDPFIKLIENASEKMEKIAPEKTGELCPLCQGDLVVRVGRYGKFVGCSNYPTCTYIQKKEKEDQPKAEPTGKLCPKCQSELVKRKSRFNTYFLGCSAFPKCNYMEDLSGNEIVAKIKKKKGKK